MPDNPLIESLDDDVVDLTKQQSAVLAERLMEICALYTLSKELSISLDIDEVFGGAEDILNKSLGMDDFSIMLLDNKSKILSIWKANDGTMKAAKGVTFRLGEGVCGIVAKTGKPELVQDVKKDARFLYYKGAKKEIGSFFSTPLKTSRGKVMGVFNVHKPLPDSIKQNETLLFNAVAGHIARALENSEVLKKAQKLAITDELTGLHSRRYFLDVFEKELSKSKRRKSHLSVIMLDLDFFKRINDTYGHPAGDEVLKKLADILKANTRRGDVAARYGGEEFFLLLPGVGAEDAAVIAKKIREVVESDLKVKTRDGSQVGVTVSGGVASYPECGETSEEIISSADKYLLLAKKTGRNKIWSMADPSEEKEYKDDRRTARRSLVGINVSNTSERLRLIDIKIKDRWRLCMVENISDDGFRGIVDVDLVTGRKYQCRSTLGNGNEHSRFFSINCARKRSTGGRCFIGAKVIDGLIHWTETVKSMSYS